MHKTTSGFTIVELLIVIVVIAILAAISIVSYLGIQDQAKATAIKSDLSNIDKQVQMFKVVHGSYPQSSPELFSGNKPTVTHTSFSTGSSDPYDIVLFCSNNSSYLIIAKQKSNAQWYIVGSQEPLREIDSTGITGSGAPTCDNKLGSASTYAQWLRTSASGWRAGLQ